jgi:hypothetical protein
LVTGVIACHRGTPLRKGDEAGCHEKNAKACLSLFLGITQQGLRSSLFS